TREGLRDTGSAGHGSSGGVVGGRSGSGHGSSRGLGASSGGVGAVGPGGAGAPGSGTPGSGTGMVSTRVSSSSFVVLVVLVVVDMPISSASVVLVPRSRERGAQTEDRCASRAAHPGFVRLASGRHASTGRFAMTV